MASAPCGAICQNLRFCAVVCCSESRAIKSLAKAQQRFLLSFLYHGYLVTRNLRSRSRRNLLMHPAGQQEKKYLTCNSSYWLGSEDDRYYHASHRRSNSGARHLVRTATHLNTEYSVQKSKNSRTDRATCLRSFWGHNRQQKRSML